MSTYELVDLIDEHGCNSRTNITNTCNSNIPRVSNSYHKCNCTDINCNPRLSSSHFSIRRSMLSEMQLDRRSLDCCCEVCIASYNCITMPTSSFSNHATATPPAYYTRALSPPFKEPVRRGNSSPIHAIQLRDRIFERLIILEKCVASLRDLETDVKKLESKMNKWSQMMVNNGNITQSTSQNGMNNDEEKPKKLGRRRRLRKPISLQKELEFSGLHGIPILINSTSNCRRLFWSCLLLGLFFLAVFHTAATIIRATQTPTQFKVSYESTQQLTFPDFTICSHFGIFLNITRFTENFLNRRNVQSNPNGDKSNNFDYAIDLEELVGLTTAIPDLGYLKSDILKATKFKEKEIDAKHGLVRIKQKFNNDIILAMNTIIDNYMLPCDSVFRKCYVDERPVSCCDIFSPLYNAFFGPCFASNMSKFPTKGDMNVMRSRKHLIWVEIADWSDPAPEMTSLDSKMISGMSFQLGRETWFNNPNGILPRSRYQIGLDVRKVKDMHVKGKCFEKSETKLSLYREYADFRCLPEQLLLKLQDEQLDCIWPLFKLFNSNFNTTISAHKPSCSAAINYTFNDLIVYAGENVSPFLRKQCLIECQRWEFSTSDWLKTSDYAGDTIILFIFFTNPSFTIFEEVQTITWMDYLSMVGGLWGLWLGSSIITFINIIEASLYVAFRRLKKRYRTKFGGDSFRSAGSVIIR